MANFKPFTRYTNGNTSKNRSDKDFIVLRKSLKLEPSDDDIFVTVTSKFIGRPDTIGSVAYNDSNLWWAVFEFNNINDPFFDLNLGQILRLPSKARLLLAINNLNKV